jgi:hypothetical protein
VKRIILIRREGKKIILIRRAGKKNEAILIGRE